MARGLDPPAHAGDGIEHVGQAERQECDGAELGLVPELLAEALDDHGLAGRERQRSADAGVARRAQAGTGQQGVGLGLADKGGVRPPRGSGGGRGVHAGTASATAR